jgi:hypothetical protein
LNVNDGSVNKATTESSNDLNTALAEFGDTPGQRRYRQRKAAGFYEERKSLGKRKHVVNQRGHRAVQPETGQEPAFNRPSINDWEPRHPSVRPACFTGEFTAGLCGYSWVDIQTRAHWATGREYDWRGQR